MDCAFTMPASLRCCLKAFCITAVLCLSLSCPGLLHAQTSSDTTESGSGSWYAFPAITYAPEISFGGGLAGGFFRESATSRPSSVQGDVLVTLRGQYMLNLNAEVYAHADRHRVEADVSLQQFPDVFYGIGRDASEEMEEDFTSRFADAIVQAERRVAENFRIGFRGRFWYEAVTEVEDTGLLDTLPITGRDGSTAVGIGLVSIYDSRDRVFFAREGTLIEAYAKVHPGLLGRDAHFTRAVVDVRRYLALRPGQVLALQGYADVVSGRVPFSLLPRIGGMERMRGYREGRYRDNVMLTAQAEWRFPIAWRFAGAVFGSVGSVAQRVNSWAADGIERAVGAGIRYRLNEQGVHIRFDYAVGREGAAFYLTALQPF